jgi:hypothetical protein
MPVNDEGKPVVAKKRTTRQPGNKMKAKNDNSKRNGRYAKDRDFKKGVQRPSQQNGFLPGQINPKAPKTPEDRLRINNPICGAPRTGKSSSGPGICCQPAGWGTPHTGIGRCKLHGGNLPAMVKQAEIERAEQTVIMFGADKKIDPQLALLEEVQRTAGHVDWLRDLIQKMDDPQQLRQVTDAGIEPAVWVRMYQDERQHLVKVCAEAIKCGVAERQVRIAEEQGRLMAMVLMAFIHDPEIDLDARQMSMAPKLIRKHLLATPAAISAEQMPESIRIKDGDVIEVQGQAK